MAVGKYKKIANFLSGNATMLVNSVVAMVIIRFLIQKLGLGTYGLISFVFALGSVVVIMGTALSGAAARYVTISFEKGQRQNASIYISNTFYTVCFGGIAAILLITLYTKTFSTVGEGVPFAFLLLMMVSIVLSAMAGVLSTGNFVKEEFVKRAAVNIFSRITYGATCGILLFYSNLGLYAVAAAALLGSLIRLLCFWYQFKKLLPSVLVKFRLFARKHVLEVGAFVSWMLLAFLGGYISRAGIVLVLKISFSKENLGLYAVGVAASNLLLSTLQCISNMTAPDIYKFIARNDFRNATARVERFLFLASLLGFTAVIALYFEGYNMLGICLGDAVQQRMVPILMGCCISAVAISYSIPISVFLAGCKRIRNYGIACLLEGIGIILAVFVLVKGGQDRLLAITLVPGVADICKNCCMVFLLERKAFLFSHPAVFVRRALVLVLVAVSVAASGMLATSNIAGTGVLIICARLFVILLPFVLYAAWEFFALGRKLSFILARNKDHNKL